MDIYTKLAAPRWLQALEEGILDAPALSRLMRQGDGTLGSIRRSMQAPKDLYTGAAHDRNLRLLHLLDNVNTKRHGELHNLAIGPGMTAGSIHVSPQAGTQVRRIGEAPNLLTRMYEGYKTTKDDLPADVYAKLFHPEDAGIRHSVVAHELAEKALDSGTHNFVGSHFGTLPYIAERRAATTEKAHDVFNKLRAISADDTAAMRFARQHGFVGNYAPPGGGRAHRSFEQAVEKMPVSDAMGRRLLTGAPITYPPQIVKPVSKLHALVSKVLPYMPEPVRRNYNNVVGKIRTQTNAPSNFNFQDPVKGQQLVREFIARNSII